MVNKILLYYMSRNIFNNSGEIELGTRLQNLKDNVINETKIITIDENDAVVSYPFNSNIADIFNQSSLDALKTLLLKNTEEAVVFTSDGNNEISFHTGLGGGNPTVNNRRLYITNDLIELSVGGTPTKLTVDELNGRISISEMLSYDNHTGVKLNFYKDGTDANGDLYEISVDTAGGNRRIIYKAPLDHLFRVYDIGTTSNIDLMLLSKDNTFINNKLIANTYAYNDGSTYPTYLSFDNLHAHITSPSGLMINNSFNFQDGAQGTIQTTTGNKNIDYKTHGTGKHNFYVNTTTQVLELDNTDSIFTSTNLKTNNIISNTDNTYSIGNSGNKFVKIYGEEVIGRYLRSSYLGDTFNEIEQFYRTFPTTIDVMNFTFNKTELTSGNTLMSIDGVADKVITYAKLELHDDLLAATDNTYNIGSSSNKFSNIYGNTLQTGTITTATNTHLEISPNGSGNIRTNRPLEIPAAQSIMLCKENNKHFQLNLAPNNEAPGSATASYGSGLTFWSSFYDTVDAAPRLFANINCRTVSPNWAGGRLEFRVRENQSSGFDGGLSGDQSALTSHQMTITPTSVDIFKTLNLSSTIDFDETLADKILLYGTTYKIGVSSNTIDYTSDNTHSFKIQAGEKMRIAGNIVASTNFIPQNDNTYDIGSGTNRWQDIYATNGTIQTSDRNQKKEIDYQDIDQYADELLKLKPCSFKFIENTSNRIHTGLISQDLQDTLFENTGAYIKDRKKKTIIEDGINKEVDDEGFNYGLRYGELISPMIRLLQKQQEQIQKQQEQINQLEQLVMSMM